MLVHYDDHGDNYYQAPSNCISINLPAENTPVLLKFCDGRRQPQLGTLIDADVHGLRWRLDDNNLLNIGAVSSWSYLSWNSIEEALCTPNTES